MKPDSNGPFSLKTIRRVWSVFFVALFLFLLWAADFRHLKGYETALFLKTDPLVYLSGLLTSWTVYKGLALALLIIIPTLFLGRFFCSWICPYGIMHHWAGKILLKRRAPEYHKENAYSPIYRIKYYILTALIALSLFGASQIGLFDPIATVSRAFIVSVFPPFDQIAGAIYRKPPVYLGGALIGFLFIGFILANRYVNRFWCRTLCPLGALLGIISSFSIMRIRRDVDKCNDCLTCLKGCQGACDPHTELRASECVVCMNCIYDCPEGALAYGLPGARSSAHKPLDASRRRIIETALASFVLYPILKSSFGSGNAAIAAVIRPPGSLAEPDFLRRCIKCSMCMKVCPTNVLQPALLEAGVEGLWTPILVNKIGYCEHHCTLCGHVCPTGAIMPMTVKDRVGTPEKKAVKLGTAFYDRGRCLPWAMNVECIVCEEVCPTSPKAIWFETKEIKDRDGSVKKLKIPYLDPKLCIGCGVCENKCPVRDTAAIRVTSVGETRSTTNRMILRK